MTTSDVRWSCTAQIDLLGFSNHLAVTNWDIRTQTGVQAIERLASLEDAIRLFEHERTDYPQLYPSGLQYIRFNDALFLGIDDEYLEPPPGRITLTGGYSLDLLRKIRPQNGQTALEGTAVEPGSDVAKFLGLVARIHTYVNRREAEKSFPGCRTVVASGLRKCFADRKGIDDFFSANFSVSTVFEAETKGNSAGLKDNHLYVEDDVGMAISYCQPCHAILGYSKFIRTDSSFIDPYQYLYVQKEYDRFPPRFVRCPGTHCVRYFEKAPYLQTPQLNGFNKSSAIQGLSTIRSEEPQSMAKSRERDRPIAYPFNPIDRGGK